MTTIQITRPNEWTNRLRKYKIYLDDNHAGTISNNTTLDLYVPAGKHILIAKMGWYGSQEIEIDIKEDEIKYAKVSCSVITKWLPLIMVPFFILFFIGKDFLPKIQWLFLVPALILIVYMLTLGRKKYLDLKEF